MLFTFNLNVYLRQDFLHIIPLKEHITTDNAEADVRTQLSSIDIKSSIEEICKMVK